MTPCKSDDPWKSQPALVSGQTWTTDAFEKRLTGGGWQRHRETEKLARAGTKLPVHVYSVGSRELSDFSLVSVSCPLKTNPVTYSGLREFVLVTAAQEPAEPAQGDG